MRFNENILYDTNDNAVIKTFHSSVLPTKRVYNEHHHTECELSIFLSGSGIYSVHGIEYTFGPGDMFLFGSNEAHCITEINDELDLLNIHFEPLILWENPENIELLSLFSMRNGKFSNKFSCEDTKLRDIIINIEKEIIEKQKGYRLQIKSALFSALIHIIRNYDYIKHDSSISKSIIMTERLKDAISYINNNLETKLSLKEIADVACLSQTYFSTMFKKLNGISPWDYIKIKRVEKAIELLKTTNMSKLEIAKKCGFESSSNFYKIFLKITGKKPNDYTNNK